MAARHFRKRERRPEDGVWGRAMDVDAGGRHGEKPLLGWLSVGATAGF